MPIACHRFFSSFAFMRLKYLFIIIAVIVSACGNSGKDGETKGGKWEKLVMQKFLDAKGALLVEMPFPSSWKMMEKAAKGEPAITGPHGLKVINYSSQNFMYTADPHMQRIYIQSGQQMRPMPEAEQLIQEDFVPFCANQNIQFVRYYELPEVTKIDKWYNDQLFKAVPMNMEIKAVGTEWKKADGSPIFLLVHITSSVSATLQTWGYWYTSLEAEAEYFEVARKQLIFSLANSRYALGPIMEYNKSEAERTGKSWAAHNQRMAQNQANFEASQRAHVNRTNAINDAIMNGWRERNEASDRQQEQRKDIIYEETNVTDPTTGQNYKVASGSNNYWMNSDGEYISTDLQDYNPNLDENMNAQKWKELKEKK